MENKDLLTRPGYRTLFRLPDGKAKGINSFINSEGKQCLVMIVDDKTYVSESPFETYREVVI